VKLAIAAIVLCLAAGIVYGGATVTINGQTIQSSGNSIVITNDTMVVDGLGKVNGSGGVSYSGTPSTVNSFLNGSGRIQKR